MTHKIVDFEEWPRAAQFRFFRTYEKPHYAVTSRVDVTRLMTKRKAQGVSVYRASLYAIGAGVHAVPELQMRFRGDEVRLYDGVEMSATVPTPHGSFNYAYLPYHPDFAVFDAATATALEKAARGGDLAANSGERDDLVYLSCLPWLDFTSINNALPHADDCIPRVSWGKIVQGADGCWSMAMTLEVHHALVDGAQVGDYFAAVQVALDRI